MIISNVKIKAILCLGAFLFTAELAARNTRVYQIEPDSSRIEWIGKKVTGKHFGTVRILDGIVEFQGNRVKGGKVIVDLASITNLDIESNKWRQKLEDHLRSEDFFFTEKFPTATFEITSVKSGITTDTGNFSYLISGMLTIRGITQEIAFPTQVFRKEKGWRSEGVIELDRTRWNIRYNSGKYFKNLGDKMISDKFTLKFRVETFEEI